MIALGWALSVGLVSIGINAVGWIAIGVNAAGFVAVGVANSAGVFSFGGANAVGGWGVGGANACFSGSLGLCVSTLATVGLLVTRVRTWPHHARGLVPLAAAVDAEGTWARARLISLGDEVTLSAGHTVIRAYAGDAAMALCLALGRGASVRVRLRHLALPVEHAGYRDDAASLVHEIVAIIAEPRPRWLRSLFGDLVGIQLALACAGMAAAVVSTFVWK